MKNIDIFNIFFSKIELILKNILIECRFKTFLRYIKHQIVAKDCRIIRCFTADAYKINFSQGDLRDLSVLLPHISFDLIRGIPRETPPYFFSHFIKEESIVVDAGAFPGDFTVLAAKIIGSRGKVIALEPNLKNRVYLEKVLLLNGVADRVKVLPYALSDGIKKVYLTGNALLSKVISTESGLRPNENKEIISTVSLDELLDQHDLLFNDELASQVVVKMDIEGSEIEAIDGAKKTLTKGVKFIIASYHTVNGQRTAEVLEKKFKLADYRSTLINPSHLTLLAEKI